MDNIVKCPYCGAEINKDVEQCPSCREWFCEPSVDFKFVSVPIYIVFSIIFISLFVPAALILLAEFFGSNFIFCACLFALAFTLLNYDVIWIGLNFKNFSKISPKKDLRKFKVLFVLFILSVFVFALIPNIRILTSILCFVLNVMISYRMLRIIEKHTFQKYNINITHHEVGMIIFRVLYVIYFLETYSLRVHNPDLRYCLELKNWVKYSFLIILTAFVVFGLVSIGAFRI